MGKSRTWGVCQRSGLRFYLDELVPDGRNPSLWVHPKFWEPPLATTFKSPLAEDRRVDHPSPELGTPGYSASWPRPGANGEALGPLHMFMTMGEVTIRIPSYLTLEDGTPIMTEDSLKYAEVE